MKHPLYRVTFVPGRFKAARGIPMLLLTTEEPGHVRVPVSVGEGSVSTWRLRKMKVGDLVRHGWKGKPRKRLGLLISEGPAATGGCSDQSTLWRVLWTTHTPGIEGMIYEEDLEVLNENR